jgi:hypothetical protein
MSDSDDTEQSTTDENDVLEDEADQPASGDPDDSDGSDGSDGSDDGDDGDDGERQGLDPKAEPDEQTKEEIEEERQRRLDPDNRPENAEVDNTTRTFDVERGQFEDSEDYDESEPAPSKDPEDPNSSEGADAGDEAAEDDDGDDDSGDDDSSS